jgi:hypothetical protein
MMKSRIEVELTQNRLLSLHEAAQELLMRYPNVDHVGVGVKESNGKLTDELCFRVYVHEKVSDHGLKKHDRIPSSLFGMRTDVLQKHGVQPNAADLGNYRPLRGGIAIANEFNQFNMVGFSGYGTMGCLARVAATNKLVGLSAMHVLEDSLPIPMISAGINIGQPGVGHIMLFTANIVGQVTVGSFTGGLDCGIFEVDSSNEQFVNLAGSEFLVQDISNLTGVAQAVCYEIVRKRGASTRLTQGVIVDVRYDGTNILINPCTDFVNFSEPGDSGAVIVNAANKVVGLLIGSSRTDVTKGVANHIHPVMVALGITIAGQGIATPGLVGIPAANCAPGGLTVCFGGAEPSITASKNYFKDLDDGTLFLSSQPGYSTSAALQNRSNAIFGASNSMRALFFPYVFNHADGWEARARNNQVALPMFVLDAADPAKPTAIVNAAFRANIVLLSDYQLNLLSTHFPGTTGAGSIDYDKVRVTFERFMNGELRDRPTVGHPYGAAALLRDGPREPNGSFEMLFAAFAWLCVENGINATKWEKIFNICVQCQELFMTVYRRRPQVAPPAGSIPIPAFTLGSTGNDLNPAVFTPSGGSPRRVQVGETNFGLTGFSFDHFNLGPSTDTLAMAIARLNSVSSIAQSNGARKAFLRAKYIGMSYSATKTAMKENLQRMMYMP